MSKLQQCSAEASADINLLLSKYDVRIVLAVLGARFAEVFAAALAAGVDRRYGLEVLTGSLDCAFTPPEKPPAVIYMDGDEVLGRKQ